MRTLTGYGLAAVVVLALLNLVFWRIGSPKAHDVRIFSVGFAVGMLGIYIAAGLYGYRQI